MFLGGNTISGLTLLGGRFPVAFPSNRLHLAPVARHLSPCSWGLRAQKKATRSCQNFTTQHPSPYSGESTIIKISKTSKKFFFYAAPPRYLALPPDNSQQYMIHFLMSPSSQFHLASHGARRVWFNVFSTS